MKNEIIKDLEKLKESCLIGECFEYIKGIEIAIRLIEGSEYEN